MNRSILIVICDFLLLSLLTFSTMDINKPGEGSAQAGAKVEMATNQADSGKDLAAVMRLALDQEQKKHEQLLAELARNRDALGKQEALLSERENQVQTVRQELRSKEQQTQGFQQEQANLQQQYAAAQSNIQTLNQQLQNSSAETVMSREKLAAMEAEARKQSGQAAALQKQLADLARSNQTILGEKQQLTTQLQIAEVEKRSATEQVTHMRDEVKVEREEKAKLAEGVQVLASKSGQLEREIRENTQLTPNTIFSDFISNRVEASFSASKPGLFGESLRRADTATVLASDGTNTYALCHVQDTPLAFSEHGTEWEGLSGTLGRDATLFPIGSVLFHAQDPRVVLMPVTAEEVRQLGCKVYRISPDPFKFQEAVLVGARDGYYGECRFQMDLTTPQYLKLDRSFLKGLFGKFNPSRGDLVFSKNGQLLGIMANDTYCMMIQNFAAMETVRFGQDVRDQHTGQILSALYALVIGMPFKLQ